MARVFFFKLKVFKGKKNGCCRFFAPIKAYFLFVSSFYMMQNDNIIVSACNRLLLNTELLVDSIIESIDLIIDHIDLTVSNIIVIIKSSTR